MYPCPGKHRDLTSLWLTGTADGRADMEAEEPSIRYGSGKGPKVRDGPWSRQSLKQARDMQHPLHVAITNHIQVQVLTDFLTANRKPAVQQSMVIKTSPAVEQGQAYNQWARIKERLVLGRHNSTTK